MSAADVELVMSYVSAGYVIGNHGEAVGAIGSGRALDLLPVDKSCGSRRVGGSDFWRPRHINGFVFCCDLQRKVQYRFSA